MASDVIWKKNSTKMARLNTNNVAQFTLRQRGKCCFSSESKGKKESSRGLAARWEFLRKKKSLTLGNFYSLHIFYAKIVSFYTHTNIHAHSEKKKKTIHLWREAKLKDVVCINVGNNWLNSIEKWMNRMKSLILFIKNSSTLLWAIDKITMTVIC